jgi:hypothetical protein
VKPGDLFWIVDQVRGEDVKHLHVVLTHPEPDSSGQLRVAVVNISTVRGSRYDDTTELKKSDHVVFVDQKYYIVYSEANFEFVRDIYSKRGYASSSVPLRPSIFRKVFDGLFRRGGLTPADVKAYCSERVSAVPGEVLDSKGK